MNKLLAITVLIVVLALEAESFRMPRQAEEEKGTIASVVDTLKFYYDMSVDTASGYVETIKDYKLEEKAKLHYRAMKSRLHTVPGSTVHRQLHKPGTPSLASDGHHSKDPTHCIFSTALFFHSSFSFSL
ncbi:uncharacterized protein LOC127657918 isoform X1 [Xyrauchen texanus]|uniref:uncharacterized protein LOC127657918 isoform X1 n=1 Tax=Xyrauchen texanus TaxID=154827 RepID=UPI002241C86E|nr:uncharacterized protein LOC127657918 isoform X1 [Xyrauchen texanus]